VPSPKRSEHQGIAEKLVRDFGVRAPAVPVDRIAKSLGAQLRFSPLDDELSGMIFVKEGTPIIGVNSLHHPNRQRFTIAHEVAHLVLHKKMITTSVHVDKQFPMLLRGSTASLGTDEIEIEANNFAARLLIPKFLLDEALVDLPFGDIDDDAPMEALAKKFRVSRKMLEFRIANLSND
jgi:Zn-dependent peptidase ImmA (M78 family)